MIDVLATSTHYGPTLTIKARATATDRAHDEHQEDRTRVIEALQVTYYDKNGREVTRSHGVREWIA